MVITLYKNGAPTTITFTIAAGAAAALFTDLTHSVTMSAGDRFSIQAVNNANVQSGAIGAWDIEFSAT